MIALASCTCKACSKEFIPTRGSKGAFCSKPCMEKHRRDSRPEWLSCVRCLADVGIGITVQARILGVSKSRIHRAATLEGIKTAIPESGSWRLHSIKFTNEKTKWWGDHASAWMDEYRPKFFDWTYEWTKHQWNEKYRCLDENSKKELNKKTWEIRKARMQVDLEYKATQMAYSNDWKKNNKVAVNTYVRNAKKKRKANDPGYRVQCNLRHRLKDLMCTARRGGTTGISGLIGCSTKQLADHLESKFKRGMTWGNYGTKWHVDHILPCASFNHLDSKQVAQCWHWTNLQPLWAKDNLEKRDSILNPQLSLLLSAI